MKRKDLINKITSGGHDLYKNPRTGKRQPVPRHADIDESLAKHILKELA